MALVALLGSAAMGCHYDDSDRCDEHMRYDKARDTCVCADYAIAVTGGCQPCAQDEVVVANACVCPANEAKGSDGVCAPCPAGCP